MERAVRPTLSERAVRPTLSDRAAETQIQIRKLCPVTSHVFFSYPEKLSTNGILHAEGACFEYSTLLSRIIRLPARPQPRVARQRGPPWMRARPVCITCNRPHPLTGGESGSVVWMTYTSPRQTRRNAQSLCNACNKSASNWPTMNPTVVSLNCFVTITSHLGRSKLRKAVRESSEGERRTGGCQEW